MCCYATLKFKEALYVPAFALRISAPLNVIETDSLVLQPDGKSLASTMTSFLPYLTGVLLITRV